MAFENMLGVCFDPTLEESFLLLQKKVKGEELPHKLVGEEDIYGIKEPWEIFDKTKKKNFFVFTKLKDNNKSGMKRVGGWGTWKIDRTEGVYDLRNELIGFKKSFVFKYKKKKAKRSADNGHWIMNEFSLRNYSLAGNYVLCRIRNKDLDKIKYSVRNVQYHDHLSTDHLQVPAVQTDKINQGNDVILRNLNPGEENPIAEQTNPNAVVPHGNLNPSKSLLFEDLDDFCLPDFSNSLNDDDVHFPD